MIDIILKIIEDRNIADKEVKLFLILYLLHNKSISLRKAYELCTEIKLFSTSWTKIDVKVADIWGKIYKEKEN